MSEADKISRHSIGMILAYAGSGVALAAVMAASPRLHSRCSLSSLRCAPGYGAVSCSASTAQSSERWCSACRHLSKSKAASCRRLRARAQNRTRRGLGDRCRRSGGKPHRGDRHHAVVGLQGRHRDPHHAGGQRQPRRCALGVARRPQRSRRQRQTHPRIPAGTRGRRARLNPGHHHPSSRSGVAPILSMICADITLKPNQSTDRIHAPSARKGMLDGGCAAIPPYISARAAECPESTA